MFGRPRPKTAKELGQLAEEHAARYLAARGYRLRARNFRLPTGPELDLVMEHKNTLVFIEVKSRVVGQSVSPRDAVTPHKQRQITRAAAAYLGTVERRERVTRFDVVEVYLTPEGRVQKIEVLEGAFSAA